ncbi:hypothetical protein HK102_003244 [Quaeritorhiza haematococci]|nr:hypothetical protein HK102_003244 [Quaeritorhiza haematococci]
MPFPVLYDSLVDQLYPKSLKLKQVQIVHRHGERTPVAVSGDESRSTFPKLEDWTSCRLTPFLHALYVSQEPHDSKHLPGATSKLPTPMMFMQQLALLQRDGQCFLGQLTDKGKHTMQKSGSNLRSLYVNRLGLLNDRLDSISARRDLYIRSTDYARTIESVQYLLDGLYPYAKRSRGTDLAIHVKTYENMYPQHDCKYLKDAAKAFRKSMRKAIQPVLDRAKTRLAACGIEFSDQRLGDVHRVYDTLACLEAHHKAWPAGVTQQDFDDLEMVNTQLWYVDLGFILWSSGYAAQVIINSKSSRRRMSSYQTSEMVRRLSIGNLVGDIRDKFMEAIRGDKGPKLAIYSGHDSTVGPLLAAFDAFDGRFPTFGALVTFELFEEQAPWGQNQPDHKLFHLRSPGQPHYIRMTYEGRALHLPACQEKGKHREGDPSLCTFEAFMSHMDRMIPKDYEQECLEVFGSKGKKPAPAAAVAAKEGVVMAV